MVLKEHEFDAQGYLDGLERGRKVSPERDKELRQEEKELKIASLVSEAYKRAIEEGQRVDIETETHKIIAYRVRKPILMRIDVREK
jgi:hypothetical protein